PEQAWGRSRDVGPATDVHALGLILYELLTGVSPFQSGSMATTLDAVRFTEPAPPSRLRPDIPAALDQICLRCLRKEANQRYRSAGELADDLRAFGEGRLLLQPARQRRVAVTIGVMALVLLLSWRLLGGWLPARPGPGEIPDL